MAMKIERICHDIASCENQFLVVFDHERVDYGEISDTEYRTVVIPIEEFKEGIAWELDSVHYISFHCCPGLGLHSSDEQPK